MNLVEKRWSEIQQEMQRMDAPEPVIRAARDIYFKASAAMLADVAECWGAQLRNWIMQAREFNGEAEADEPRTMQ